MQYSGSAIRDCGAIPQHQSGPGCTGRRLPPVDRRLAIAAAALTESGWDEHSEGDPRPHSIPDTVRSNPADGVAMAAVQGSVIVAIELQMPTSAEP